jgi:hypothetical protein
VISQFRKALPVRLSLLLILLLILATLASNAFGQTLMTLYSFGAAAHDGLAPASSVIIDQNGNLFGITGAGALTLP